jgi:hypothetical protein
MKKSSALVLIILAFALFYTFTSPQYRDAKSLSGLAGEYRRVVDNVDRISESKDALLLSYESIPAIEKERLSKILPSNADAVGLARELDTIAARHGFTILGVKVESGPDENSAEIVLPEFSAPYEKVLVSFNFISNYQSFSGFLSDLEKSLRIMDVKTVSFLTGEAPLYEHQVTVETYWLK